MCFLKAYRRAMEFLYSIFIYFSLFALIALSVYMVMNAVFRSSGGFKDCYELSALGISIAVSFAVGYCELNRNHLVVDLVTSHIKGKAHDVMAIVCKVICVVMACFLARACFNYMLQSNDVTTLLRISHKPFIVIWFIGLVFLTLALLLNLLEMLHDLFSKDNKLIPERARTEVE